MIQITSNLVAMSIRTLFCINIISLLLSGCVAIPQHHSVAGQYHESGSINTDCFGKDILSRAHASTGQNDGLNSRGFVLLNWNSYKGVTEEWQEDLEGLSSSSDLLVLQEAYLTDHLQNRLTRQFHWDIARAFAYNDIYTGVLTASRIKPDFLCSFRVLEPLGRTPKTVLITRYPLSDTDKTLLLANIHMVNFTLNISAYRGQLEKIVQVVEQHRGPLIITGDFNSWNKKRMDLLKNNMQELGMRAVAFDKDHRVSFMGRKVDHIYYRKLIPLQAFTEKVSTSDHNPMLVTFRLAGDK